MRWSFWCISISPAIVRSMQFRVVSIASFRILPPPFWCVSLFVGCWVFAVSFHRWNIGYILLRRIHFPMVYITPLSLRVMRRFPRISCFADPSSTWRTSGSGILLGFSSVGNSCFWMFLTILACFIHVFLRRDVFSLAKFCSCSYVWSLGWSNLRRMGRVCISFRIFVFIRIAL